MAWSVSLKMACRVYITFSWTIYRYYHTKKLIRYLNLDRTKFAKFYYYLWFWTHCSKYRGYRTVRIKFKEKTICNICMFTLLCRPEKKVRRGAEYDDMLILLTTIVMAVPKRVPSFDRFLSLSWLSIGTQHVVPCQHWRSFTHSNSSRVYLCSYTNKFNDSLSSSCHTIKRILKTRTITVLLCHLSILTNQMLK